MVMPTDQVQLQSVILGKCSMEMDQWWHKVCTWARTLTVFVSFHHLYVGYICIAMLIEPGCWGSLGFWTYLWCGAIYRELGASRERSSSYNAQLLSLQSPPTRHNWLSLQAPPTRHNWLAYSYFYVYHEQCHTAYYLILQQSMVKKFLAKIKKGSVLSATTDTARQ